jgi:hypothetical protein
VATKNVQGGELVRKLLRKMTEVVHQATGPGAMLNAMHEIDRAASSVIDVDAQLRRVTPASTHTRQAA